MGEADDMSITSSSLVLQLVVLCSPGFADNIRLCFASSGAKPMLNGPGNRDILPPSPPPLPLAKSLLQVPGMSRRSAGHDFN